MIAGEDSTGNQEPSNKKCPLSIQPKRRQICQPDKEKAKLLRSEPDTTQRSKCDLYRAKCKKQDEHSARQFIDRNQLPLLRRPQKQRYDSDIYRSNNNGKKHITKINPKYGNKWHKHDGRHGRPIQIIVPIEK